MLDVKALQGCGDLLLLPEQALVSLTSCEPNWRADFRPQKQKQEVRKEPAVQAKIRSTPIPPPIPPLSKSEAVLVALLKHLNAPVPERMQGIRRKDVQL